jgi:hypothetical protein
MSEAERAFQRALAEACLGQRSAGSIAADLRAFLAAHGVPEEDVAAAVAQPGRFAVYRALVRNGIASVVLRVLPRTRARLNASAGGRFDADLAAFVAEVGPRTHRLRDVPAELLAWAEPRWRADPGVPGYVADLARHELAGFEIGAAPSADVEAGPGAPVALDRPLRFAAAVQLLRYAWAVHELDEDGDDEVAPAEPARRDVALLGYRDAGHAVQWLELTPRAAAILERLLAGQTLGAAVAQAGAPASVLEDVARLLADLAERGVILGAGG